MAENGTRTMSRARRGMVASVSALAVGPIMALTASPAAADQQFKIDFTGIGIYPHSEPTMSPDKRSGAAVPDGTTINVVCETEGEPVNNGYATISIWMKTDKGTYFPNSFVRTGYDGWTPGVPRCPTVSTDTSDTTMDTEQYDRDLAVQWAIDNVYAKPPYGENDCTFFVSQALWRGHIPPTPDWEPSSQFSSDTRAALVADDLKNYLLRNGITDEVREVTNVHGDAIPGAQQGDIIGYDWDSDGILDHLAIVTSTIAATEVSAHSNPRLHAPWDLNARQNGKTRFYLMHIVY